MPSKNKILPLLLCLFLLGGVISSYAAGPDTSRILIQDPPEHIFKTSPFAMLFSQIPGTGETRIMYERVLSPKRSSFFGLSYIYVSPLIEDQLTQQFANMPFTPKFEGFRLQGGLKHYLLNELPAPYGLYVGLHASYNNLMIYIPKASPYRRAFNNLHANVVFFNASVISGVQVVLFKKLAFDAYTGIGYRDNYLNIYNTSLHTTGVQHQTINMQEVFPAIGRNLKLSFSINMGLAF